MKIISALQTKVLDQHTIISNNIISDQLMESASMVFSKWFSEQYKAKNSPAWIFCGPGNNGGDGLAIARLLIQQGFRIHPVICQITENTSKDFTTNLVRLKSLLSIDIQILTTKSDVPIIASKSIVIDAIFGAGLNRPVTGYWATLLDYLNQLDVLRIAVDVPSGLYADQHSPGTHFNADRTLSFQLPKLAFMLPENAKAVGDWTVLPIGLSLDFLATIETPFHYIDSALAKSWYHFRTKFSHKGNFGHALLIIGSFGKIGAAVLATSAGLRSGAGLVTAYIPACGYDILQSTVPEAMVLTDPDRAEVTAIPTIKDYRAIGMGCGIGQSAQTQNALSELLRQAHQPLVLDADALNLLGANPELLDLVPPGSILTPHPKEFSRLFGNSTNEFERLHLLREQAQHRQLYIVLKGAHTSIATPQGLVFFNSTGNPGMATGGSGDVLTGMITGLLAQGYSSEKAALLGVYLHGVAGDVARERHGEEAMLAGDIVKGIGAAYERLKG